MHPDSQHKFDKTNYCILCGIPRIVDTEDPRVEKCRPNWHETWMSIAKTVAERSYDPRLKVGAIIVSEDNTKLLALGYNGNYKGGPNIPDSPDPGQSGFIHAEVNALVKCDYNFSKKKIMYLTHSPCLQCAKLIVNADISEVIYENQYRDLSGIQLLKTCGISINSYHDVIFSGEHHEET